MENATKALLIAAAVLIAIVLIALGVNLLNAGQDTSGQAETVGNSLSTQINSVASDLSGSISSAGK